MHAVAHFLFIGLQSIILWIMHFIPGLRLRVSEETEDVGIDESDMGEFAYDYVGLESDTRPLITQRATATAMNMDPHSENHYMKERGSQGSAGQRSYGL
jgi:Amt family ammonium transporter